jgi:hypothetical protein
MPDGFSSDGLRLRFEFLGLPFVEGTLFKAAYDFEQSTKIRRPPGRDTGAAKVKTLSAVSAAEPMHP